MVPYDILLPRFSIKNNSSYWRDSIGQEIWKVFFYQNFQLFFMRWWHRARLTSKWWKKSPCCVQSCLMYGRKWAAGRKTTNCDWWPCVGWASRQAGATAINYWQRWKTSSTFPPVHEPHTRERWKKVNDFSALISFSGQLMFIYPHQLPQCRCALAPAWLFI